MTYLLSENSILLHHTVHLCVKSKPAHESFLSKSKRRVTAPTVLLLHVSIRKPAEPVKYVMTDDVPTHTKDGSFYSVVF